MGCDNTSLRLTVYECLGMYEGAERDLSLRCFFLPRPNGCELTLCSFVPHRIHLGEKKARKLYTPARFVNIRNFNQSFSHSNLLIKSCSYD